MVAKIPKEMQKWIRKLKSPNKLEVEEIKHILDEIGYYVIILGESVQRERINGVTTLFGNWFAGIAHGTRETNTGIIFPRIYLRNQLKFYPLSTRVRKNRFFRIEDHPFIHGLYGDKWFRDRKDCNEILKANPKFLSKPYGSYIFMKLSNNNEKSKILLATAIKYRDTYDVRNKNQH